MSATTLILSRHGQTVWHAENRYAGVSDVDLTDEGLDQAQALAQWALAQGSRGNSVRHVISSPVSRAVQTATPVAHALGLSLRLEPELREMSFGVAEGQTIGELRKQDPEMVRRFTDDPVGNPFPEAEDPAQAAQRGRDALLALASDYPGQTLLVVAHNTLLRLSLCRLLGLEVSRYRTLFPRLDNGCLSEIRISGAGTLDPAVSLLSLNVPLATPQPTRSIGSRHHS